MSTDGRWRKTPKKIPGVDHRGYTDATGPYWVFRVRWEDPTSGKKLTETCASPQEALDFKANLRLLARRGGLDELELGREVLTVFAAEWFHEYARTNLARKTSRAYASCWKHHLLPRMGHLQLRQITPKVVAKLKDDLLEDGVGAPTIAKTMGLLQAMFREAILWGRVTSNPVKEVAKPFTPRRKVIRPFTVAEVEALIAWMLEHRTRDEALLCELLAYTGARPQDALALDWDHIGGRRVTYAWKLVDGKRVPGAKTGDDKARDVELLPIVAADLTEHRAAARKPEASALIFGRGFDGIPWTESDYKNWQRADRENQKRRVTTRAGGFPRAAAAIGRPDATPYFLRHTYASLRLAEQRLSLQEIANEMGHSIEMLSGTYAHVISDLRGEGPINPNDLITAARAIARQGVAQ